MLLWFCWTRRPFGIMAKDYHHSPDIQRQRRGIWIQLSACSSRFWTLREYRWRSRIISIKYLQGKVYTVLLQTSTNCLSKILFCARALENCFSRCRTFNKKQFQPTNHNKHSNKFSFKSSLTLLFSSTLPARINSSSLPNWILWKTNRACFMKHESSCIGYAA